MPKHYNDFVFRDGKLLGEFEEMYVQSTEVPWHQDKIDAELNVRLSLDLLQAHGPFDRIHEFGMGLGYFLRAINHQAGTSNTRLSGSDISQTACHKAKDLIPDGNFWVEDLMKADHSDQPPADTVPQGRGLYAMRGIFWYVFPELETVMQNIAAKPRFGDLVFVAQNFPPLDTEFIGKSEIPNPVFLKDLFSRYFDPIKTLYLEDHINQSNDNWFLGLFTAKDR